MKKHITKSLLALTLLSFSIAGFSATMTAFISAHLKEGQWWSIEAIGSPTGYANVGKFGGGSKVKESSLELADDAHGKYRMTEIKYFIGTYDEANNPQTVYTPCTLQDSTTGPVNEVNARVLVHILPNNTCTATISNG